MEEKESLPHPIRQKGGPCLPGFKARGLTGRSITVTQFLIWVVIAIIVGLIGELIAGRRAPNGIIGSIVLGFFSILLIVGVFHFSIQGEPTLAGVPLISAIIGAAILVTLWSSLAYPAFFYRRTA